MTVRVCEGGGCVAGVRNPRDVRQRPGGRWLCGRCNRLRIQYENHWFTRSLRFKVDRPKELKQRKSLPGQLPLFD